MTTVSEYDRDTVAFLAACGIEGSLLGRVERLTREVADQTEANHPARLLGVAQVAIETALRLTDVDEIHDYLTEALGRIKPVVQPTEPRPVVDVQAAFTERMRQLEPNGYPEKAVHA